MKSEYILCKSDHDFILVFNKNHTSIMHRFRYNQVLPINGNDVVLFSSLRGAAGSLSRWIMKERPDFITVDSGNHMSIMHRFRYNQVLQFAGNDVIVLSPLGGAEINSLGWILEGRPRLYISF